MKEYYIVKAGEKKGPFTLKELKYEHLLLEDLIWKDGWPDWKKVEDAISDIPGLELLIEEDASSKAESPRKKNEPVESSSITLGIYTFIGDHIDLLLRKNADEVEQNALYSRLAKMRAYYKSLTEVQRRSFNFLLSAAIVYLFFFFIAVLTPSNRFSTPYEHIRGPFLMVCVWSTMVFFDLLKWINVFFQKVTKLFFLFDFFMPKVVISIIAKIARFVILLIIAIYTSMYIGLPYLLYRIVMLFVDRDKVVAMFRGSKEEEAEHA